MMDLSFPLGMRQLTCPGGAFHAFTAAMTSSGASGGKVMCALSVGGRERHLGDDVVLADKMKDSTPGSDGGGGGGGVVASGLQPLMAVLDGDACCCES